MMHRCHYCPASFTVYADLLLHRHRQHWDDYINEGELRSYELLAAEGMIGLKDENQ